MRLVVIGLAVGAMLAPAIVAAQERPALFYMTGGELEAMCRSKDASTSDQCRAYIVGSVDVMLRAKQVAGTAEPCIPQGVNAGRLQDETLAFMERYPSARGEPAARVVGAVVAAGYACGPSPRSPAR